MTDKEMQSGNALAQRLTNRFNIVSGGILGFGIHLAASVSTCDNSPVVGFSIFLTSMVAMFAATSTMKNYIDKKYPGTHCLQRTSRFLIGIPVGVALGFLVHAGPLENVECASRSNLSSIELQELRQQQPVFKFA